MQIVFLPDPCLDVDALAITGICRILSIPQFPQSNSITGFLPQSAATDHFEPTVGTSDNTQLGFDVRKASSRWQSPLSVSGNETLRSCFICSLAVTLSSDREVKRGPRNDKHGGKIRSIGPVATMRSALFILHGVWQGVSGFSCSICQRKPQTWN